MNGYFKLKQEDVIAKRHDLVAKVKQMVDAEYAKGRNTVMGDSGWRTW